MHPLLPDIAIELKKNIILQEIYKMGLLTTNILAVINNSGAPISLIDAENKGTNVSGLPTNQVAGTNSMPVPWWYGSGKNKDFSEHNIQISSSSSDLNYYIWQYENDIYYNSQIPQPGKYNDGSVLLNSINVDFVITINSDGSLSTTVVNVTETVASALQFLADNITFITDVGAAVIAFCASESGVSIIEQMTATLQYPPSANPPNYASQVLSSPAFSSLNLPMSGAAAELAEWKVNPPQAYTAGIGGGFAAGFGQNQSFGVVWQPSANDWSGFYSASVILGVEAGAAAGLQVGIWFSPMSDLSGFGLGVTGNVTIGAGIAVTIYGNGFVISVETGGEAGAALVVGATIM